MSSWMPAPSAPKQFYKNGNHRTHKPTGKKGFHPHYLKRQNKDPPQRNTLLHRLSLPSSSSSSPLLERIGGSIQEETESNTADPEADRNYADGRVFQSVKRVHADLTSPATSHDHAPEPGEVEQFLKSVIGAPPSPPANVYSVDTPVSSALDLPLRQLVTVESPTQVASSLLSPSPTMPDRYQHSPLLGDTMAPPSSTFEECRKHLVPVLLASANARGPGNRLDSEQCHQLLSDDCCRSFLQQAKDMRYQLSLASTAPVNQNPSGSLKRDRADETNIWVRRTRSRFDLTSAPEVSRKDGDITLVDFTGRRSPPKAPRAMLQASQAPLMSAQSEAPYPSPAQASSFATDPHCLLGSGPTSLIALVQTAVEIFPTPQTGTDMESVSTAHLTGESSGQDPSQMVSPAHAVSSRSTDLTQPGTWFRQQGSQYAEIMDVHIDVSDEMFYLSCERQPFRLRMHLRLCSVPIDDLPMMSTHGDTQDTVDLQSFHWPSKGKLVIQVNPESERSKTWLPYTLVSPFNFSYSSGAGSTAIVAALMHQHMLGHESDPLDVTSCVHPGKNTFRFIQLGDLSQFAFVLVASPPLPREDAWRSWDWASSLFVNRLRETSDDAMNGLSEFADMLVHVRS